MLFFCERKDKFLVIMQCKCFVQFLSLLDAEAGLSTVDEMLSVAIKM